MPNPNSIVARVSEPIKAKRSRFDAALNRPTCPPRVIRYKSAISMLEHMSIEQGSTQGARLLMHAAWHLENAKHVTVATAVNAAVAKLPPTKLDAFAIFMGEWAAKIRNAVR